MNHQIRSAAWYLTCGLLSAAVPAAPASAQCTEEVHSKLIGSDVGMDAHFGAGVCVNGDLAIIGASHDDHGSAFIYRFDGTQWTEEAKLLPPDIPNEEYRAFGLAVAAAGDLAVVAASRPDG
ncbi:MAG: hypothetical protein JSV91_14900 [Phycisphaerales bacterium]|nr:MAG: hypothetical protein JSV91_14900 [Phycisphaerales bacterium]